ncbi:hypothetical protein LCGC14_1417530 [marine sediment metagenome]|uniref:Uncharacterized protein n=1 Tax=marine sediment metagenome TaxID=412755 RepID=A0A0F9MU04_9ZZZZ
MKWLSRLFNPSAYDQGHQDGFKEGYKEGQDWGHDHGACEHTHPFQETLAVLGHKQAVTMDEYQIAREKQGVKFGVTRRRGSA